MVAHAWGLVERVGTPLRVALETALANDAGTNSDALQVAGSVYSRRIQAALRLQGFPALERHKILERIRSRIKKMSHEDPLLLLFFVALFGLFVDFSEARRIREPLVCCLETLGA